jgi:deoxyribodipyrimidine photo-lyase
MPGYILYWMQQAQRAEYNQALNFAIDQANKQRLPLLVCFVLTDFPEAQNAHYIFMLQGIREVFARLTEKRIGFIIKKGDIVKEVSRLAIGAEMLIMDRGWLSIQRSWRKAILKNISCPSRIINTDTIVPVTVASDKAEIGARTLRPRIKRYLDDYLIPLQENFPLVSSKDHTLVTKESLPLDKIRDSFTSESQLPFKGGYIEAQKLLAKFIDIKLAGYHEKSNDPSLEIRSCLSSYLHFGQISSLDISLQILAAEVPEAAKNAFLEQLIIRRELAINFVWFTPDYDKYENAVPGWAKISLKLHAEDKREYLYTLRQLEQADTHDIYWNAAQNEMLKTGFMHNYMRMYWGKKIIEWTKSPQEAFERTIYLNNKYELDGRDANSFAGIAWCYGLHDHPWKERAVFGKIRYMNDKGLERKFNIRQYAAAWNQ